ncbi:MAG: DNA gyrase subunit A, partial [Tenuifilaceae bacterium]|nr:DNA gyrase subunit A [Tenuifilaceae bacterium]
MDNSTYSDITDELSYNFLAYAAAVNTDRAIPDAKSGLKPVARRILWDMYVTGLLSSKGFKKSATIVGDTMGRFHPHGDSSIYGALVRLAQPWIMRYPLIDFHGNKGNIGGDGAASMRYTEAKLSKIAEFGMLDGLKKKTVDFMLNYSEDEEEPTTLISLFPNLLCNPNSGIGVAMATNWLPHNLTEVGNGILAYLENQEITIEELVAHIPGPDFPLGGKIINKKNMLSCYKTGRGRVIVQARYDLETRAGKQLIVFKELPFGVNSEALLEEIDKLYTKGEITGIQAVRDESNKKGLRIVIELVKGGDVSSIVNKLYKHTKLQSNENFNQVALVDKVPTLLNLKQVIEIYVNHQIDIIVKEIQFDLTKAKVRLNIVEGLLIALEDIDNVISLIKASSSAADARVQLAKKYKLNEDQAKAIVDMKLGKLAGIEKVEIQDEQKKLSTNIAEFEDILKSDIRQHEILKERLTAFIKEYGDTRRTEITNVELTKEEKAAKIIEPEDVVVILTKGGHIKRVPTKNFRIQKRNGKGSKNKDDSIL